VHAEPAAPTPAQTAEPPPKGEAEAQGEASASAVLAAVGDTQVTAEDLMAFARQQPMKLQRLATPDGQAVLLRELIENRLVNLAAAQASGLGPDASEDERREAVRKLERREWPAQFPSDEDVRAHYDAHRAEYGIPAAVRIRDIFFPVAEDASPEARAQAKARAEAVLAAARGGADFEQLAKEHAHTEALRRVGGDQKYLPLHEFPDLATATADMTEGEISDVIERPGGFQILQFLGRSEAVSSPYAGVKEEIRAQLAEQSRQKRKRQFIHGYADKVGVRILQPALGDAWPGAVAKAESP
jgi:parvulin-like peptidyl-prolyl isomerase